MEDNNKNRILTRDNYVPWFKRLIEDTCHMQGIEELLMDGKEMEFRVKEPEYRIPAIKEGDALTPDNRQREGYIINSSGNFLELAESVKKRLDKIYIRALEKASDKQDKYENNKRSTKKIIIQNIGKEVKDMLQLEPNYKKYLKEDNIVEMMKIIKRCSTGRGTSSVVLDGQRIMNMRLIGDTAPLILKTVNEFSEAVDQLKEGRTEKEIIEGLLSGIFLTLVAPCKSLDRQIDNLMEIDNIDNWGELSKKLMKVIRNKLYLKQAILKTESENGMVEANLTMEERKNMKKRMICFKCERKDIRHETATVRI